MLTIKKVKNHCNISYDVDLVDQHQSIDTSCIMPWSWCVLTATLVYSVSKQSILLRMTLFLWVKIFLNIVKGLEFVVVRFSSLCIHKSH